jgi:TPP-dependent pyruvate/acetoin dehydrogenase alpha subunit
MVLAREVDRRLSAANPRWFPIEGEEATVVGAFCETRADDAVAPHYRDPFVVYLMRGAELWRLCAQVLGKTAGYSAGRSLMFTGPAALNVVPWVAGDLGTSIGVATGAALAFRRERSDRVCVCSFGDGTANRGDVHEALTMAALWRLPIVYVCQNNGWSISQAAGGYLPAPIVDRAGGYGIPGMAIDGNDVEAVRTVAVEAIARARRGDGPTLIEARTRRVKGHWAGDPGDYMAEPVDALSDPLELLAGRLRDRGTAVADLDRAIADAAAQVDEALARAAALPVPNSDDLAVEGVYA